MAPRRRSKLFPELVTHTIEALAERGSSVTPAAAEDVLDGVVESVAQRLGITPAAALRYVDPHQIGTS
jgi:hypothetical protein